MSDYQGDHVSHSGHSSPQAKTGSPVPEGAPFVTVECQKHQEHEATDQERPYAHRRPNLPLPRRTYAVMDNEPIPQTQPQLQPPKDYTLLDLPSEIHYAILDFLDPIDSTCLGLTNRSFYDMHRRLHGAVPFSVHYLAPNDIE